MDCIFCKIIADEIPSAKIYEDADTLAFLDIRPINSGHALVIPKKHFRNILDIPTELWSKVAETARLVAIAVKKATNADGVNMSSSHEPAAGQEVFHLHLHVIPRFDNDGLSHWPQKSYAPGEAAEVAEKIKNAF